MHSVYLLVNLMGTKTKQWVVIDDGTAYPEVFNKIVVAKAIERILNNMERMGILPKRDGEIDRYMALIEAKRVLKYEIAETTMIEDGKCPEGKMWTGTRNIGHFACLKCPHLREDGREATKPGTRGTYKYKWLCGILIREVMVARRMADR